jgi:hypothetical protein
MEVVRFKYRPLYPKVPIKKVSGRAPGKTLLACSKKSDLSPFPDCITTL